MSRSGYSDDGDYEGPDIWPAILARVFRGRRGQSFLHELLAALDAMPVKRLIADNLVKDGEVCTMGAICVSRGLDASCVDAEEYKQVAALVKQSETMVREIAWWNDEGGGSWETPEERWVRMRAWVQARIMGEHAVPESQSSEVKR